MIERKDVARAEAERLHAKLEALLAAISRDSDAQLGRWAASIVQDDFRHSASNLAHYLALRNRDLRSLQRSLTVLGLSSLGRLESRVLPALLATKASLAAIAGLPAEDRCSRSAFFAGERQLAARTHALLGTTKPSQATAVLVTCPREAADDPSFMRALVDRGVQAIRINCAHDGPEQWELMIGHARAAAKAEGCSIKVLMDLAGPKIRTGRIGKTAKGRRIGVGDRLAIVAPGGLGESALPKDCAAVECSLPEALSASQIGHRVFVDDGKLGTEVEKLEPWGLLVRVTSASDDSVKLKPEKGLNFPDVELKIPALTNKDLADLDFVTQHADGIEFSFVQTADDVRTLQEALAQRRPRDWQTLSIVLKIETATAVRNLPDMLIQAAGQQPVGIMIARGDLAVELGFVRMAEMQEEILWIGEAAHVPVIWATQVLEHLVKTGTPSRGEMTDAAMAARAECVMLNKGPHLLEAIDQLHRLLGRMEQNQHKKTPQLRRLKSW